MVRRYASLRRRRTRARQIKSLHGKLIRGLLFLGALILIIIFLFGDHGFYQLYRLRVRRAEIQAHIDNLRQEKQVLEAEKRRLETDYEYIERLAREKYRMAKKGEKVFKVIERKD